LGLSLALPKLEDYKDKKEIVGEIETTNSGVTCYYSVQNLITFTFQNTKQ